MTPISFWFSGLVSLSGYDTDPLVVQRTLPVIPLVIYLFTVTLMDLTFFLGVPSSLDSLGPSLDLLRLPMVVTVFLLVIPLLLNHFLVSVLSLKGYELEKVLDFIQRGVIVHHRSSLVPSRQDPNELSTIVKETRPRRASDGLSRGHLITA